MVKRLRRLSATLGMLGRVWDDRPGRRDRMYACC
jgi:hypothetical protein